MPNKTSVIHLAGNSAQDESALAKVTSCLTKKKECFPIFVHTGPLGTMYAIHHYSTTLNIPYGLLSTPFSMGHRLIQQIPTAFLASTGPCLFVAFQVDGNVWLHEEILAKCVALLFLQGKGCCRY